MAMDTVTGHWSDERPAWGSGRRSGVTQRDAGTWDVGDGAGRAAPVSAPRRRAVSPSGARRGPAPCADAHAPDLHGSRLTPRGRLIVAMVWLLMAASAVLMLATLPGDGAEPPVMTTKVMVEPGQTLRDLAAHVQPTADRQETVAAIMSLNGLESASQIRPGDILVVPVEP